MSYWAIADLIGLLGTTVVTEIFDDSRQGYPNPVLVGIVQSAADAEVDAALARIYPGPFPIVQNFKSWGALTSYNVGQMVVPLAAPNGYAFRVVGATGTSGASEPTWPTQLGATVIDGTVTWVCIRLVPQMILMASLLWGKCLSYERHPEYLKVYGSGPRKDARAYLDRLVAARAYLTDALNLGNPGNVGGVVYSLGPRMILDVNGQTNSGDF